MKKQTLKKAGLALGLMGLASIPLILATDISWKRKPKQLEEVVESGKIEEKIIGSEKSIRLPTPRYHSEVSVEEAISKRTSTRRLKNEPLTLNNVSQLLWAAGGKNTVDGVTCATRTYPSASHIYPLEIYLIAGDVKGLSDGIYHYNWRYHTINLIKERDLRQQLSAAILGKKMVDNAPISLVFTENLTLVSTANPAITCDCPDDKQDKTLLYRELGHSGQNVHLQAEALGLGTVVVTLWDESVEPVKQVLGVKDEKPLYIMPVGKKE